MKNIIGFLITFLLLLLSYFYSHVYIANFISKASFLKNKSLSKDAFFLLFLLSLLSLIARVKFEYKICEHFYLFGLSWTGVILILLVWCFVGDIFRILLKNCNLDLIILFVLILSSISVVGAFYEGFKIPKVKTIDISLKNIDQNYTMVFISDLHIDFSFKNKFLLKVFDRINSLNSDLLIIGGDFVDPGFKLTDEIIVKSDLYKFPKIIILGNHEYYFGIEKSQDVFSKLNFKLLKNESFEFGAFNIIGIGDIKTEDIKETELLKILEQHYKKEKVNILLSHQPLYFKEISEKFDIIMLSAHTHKGQIFPFHIFTKIFYKYFYGLYKNKNSILYVTSGSGVWGPPMRFLADSEIVKINFLKE